MRILLHLGLASLEKLHLFSHKEVEEKEGHTRTSTHRRNYRVFAGVGVCGRGAASMNARVSYALTPSRMKLGVQLRARGL